MKLLLLLALVAAVTAFWTLGWQRYLSLESLKQHQEAWSQWVSEHPIGAPLGFLGLYIGVTMLSLPGATILTLAAGAIFGFAKGLLLASVASSLGATAAFLITRWILRDWAQAKMRQTAPRAQKSVEEGIRREGAFYLLSLRLIPVFPFFLVNLAMGLTSIRAWPFLWVSALGMLPGTAVYVNAGTQLASITSPRDVVSLPLLLSFAALGLLPLLAKLVLNAVQRRKRIPREFRSYKKPSSFDYNLVVIGAGSGGLISAYLAASLKSKVALIERDKMGGDCLNTGCVPSKALIRSARFIRDAQRAQELGIRNAELDFSFGQIMERVSRVVKQVEPHDSVERYTKLGVECLKGTAKLVSPYHVEVDGDRGKRRLSAKAIVIATGAKPRVPMIPGLLDLGPLTSDTIWALRKLPERLLVVGGGPIGCELAQCFAAFGSKVTIIEKGPRLIEREDEEASATVRKSLERDGIRVLTGMEVSSFRLERGAKLAQLSIGKHIAFDQVLVALGREANVKGFGLEELGIKIAAEGRIEADEYLATNYPHISVCGDVVGPYQLTHFASHQAYYAAVNSLFQPFFRQKTDYSVVPWATFTNPEVARVGLIETQAREQGIPYEVTRYGIDDLDRAIADSEAEGFVKVLTSPGSDKILGVTYVGQHAGDLIAELVLAMKNGIGLKKILGTIYIYPTLAESTRAVAGAWRRAQTSPRSLRILERFHSWRRG